MTLERLALLTHTSPAHSEGYLALLWQHGYLEIVGPSSVATTFVATTTTPARPTSVAAVPEGQKVKQLGVIQRLRQRLGLWKG